MKTIPEEGQTVERKESLGERREVVETCAAFASAQGGRIYIGVRDNGAVVGVQIGKGTLEGLANVARISGTKWLKALPEREPLEPLLSR
jgi:ATP-dependent DNA helicase RecG